MVTPMPDDFGVTIPEFRVPLNFGILHIIQYKNVCKQTIAKILSNFCINGSQTNIIVEYDI